MTEMMARDSQLADLTPKLWTDEEFVLPAINDHDTFSEVLGKLSMLGFIHYRSFTCLGN
jgi:hypothetical protein